MKIVGIHGIDHQFAGANVIKSQWLPALQDGLDRAGVSPIIPEDFSMVFYGDLFRPEGVKAGGIPPFTASDIRDNWETDLLVEWWRNASILAENNINNDDRGEDPNITGPTFQGKGTPRVVQGALRQLSKSRFFRKLGGEKMLIFSLKQVRRYLFEQEIKKAIQQRVCNVVTQETRVIVGHSLGSVVAYEALCANPAWNIHTLVTLGSPLGISNLIFDKLTPKPENKLGKWPNVKQWFNIADNGDIVALEKELAPLFGSVVDDTVYNGADSHSATSYLTEKKTGKAIASGII